MQSVGTCTIVRLITRLSGDILRKTKKAEQVIQHDAEIQSIHCLKSHRMHVKLCAHIVHRMK